MSAIQASTGLISGIPIQDTVDQLMAVARRPRNLLAQRTEGIESERSAVDTLAARLLSLRFSLTKFNTASTFEARTAQSSDKGLLSATVASGASPSVGDYRFTPLQTASAHQLVSRSFADLSGGLGAGSLRFGFGGHVDKGRALSELNAGEGVAGGEIRITDKNGDSAVIDLRAAQSVDDVLEAINASAAINVTAAARGDRFVITDNTGGAGTLTVQEVGLGTTAAGLGLAGVGESGGVINGQDVFTLDAETSLASLNDGAGVRIDDDLEAVDDLLVTLADGTEAGVDLSGATTLADVLDAINEHEELSGKVTAAIAPDGARLEITDLTSGGGELSIASAGAGAAAEDLGVAATGDAGVITGRRVAAGLQDTLLSSLKGGQGLALGELSITDRAGAAVNVDLSSAETLTEVVDLINASGAGVTAAINDSRSGLALTDTSGGSGNLVVANGAAGTTADDLGLAIDEAVDSVDSGSLNRRTVSETTRLSSLRGGAGVSLTDIRITDSNGVTGVADLNKFGDEVETVGDVIDRINALSIDVTASINERGDGILLTDTADGAGKLTVAEVGSGTAAADLRLLAAASETNESGQQVIDGSTSYAVDLSSVTATDGSVQLSTLNDGAGVDLGVFEVKDSTRGEDDNGFVVNLGAAGDEAFTVTDVIDKINAAATNAGSTVRASVSDAGTGIQLVDTADGPHNLTVADLGSGTAAADLGIAGAAGDANAAGEQKISSPKLFDAGASEANALEGLASQVNSLDAGVTASVLFDGSGRRLVLTADETGAANQLLIEGGAQAFAFNESSKARDAVLQYGGSSSFGGVTVTSTDNEFEQLIDGLKLNLHGANGSDVNVTVAKNDQPLVDVAQGFVDAYNSMRGNLDTVTEFDPEANTTGVLFGRSEVLRVDTDLGRVVTNAYSAGGEFRTLASVGISLGENGKLTLDAAALRAAYASNPGDVERLFKGDAGVVAAFTGAIDQLAGEDSSLLATRSDTLEATIESNNDRIATMDEFLGRQRESLLREFIALEESIAAMQSNLSMLENISSVQAPARARSALNQR